MMVRDIAMAATVVDFLRGTETKGNNDEAIPIEIANTHIGAALGCMSIKDLAEVQGWRRIKKLGADKVSYAIRTKGRYAILPDDCTILDIRILQEAMEREGLGFPEYPMLEVSKASEP